MLALQQVSSYWAFLTSPTWRCFSFLSPLSYTFWHWWGTQRSYCSQTLTPNSTHPCISSSPIFLPGPCFTTSVVPQMLWNLKGPDKTISYTGCVIQLYVALGLGSTECVLIDCYGLWPLQCYLSTPPLWSDHAPKASPATSSSGLDQWLCGVHGSDHPCFPAFQPSHGGWLHVRSLPWLRLPVWTQPSWKMSSP